MGDFRARVVDGVDGQTTLYFFGEAGRRASLTFEDGAVTMMFSDANDPPSVAEVGWGGALISQGKLRDTLKRMAAFCKPTPATASTEGGSRE